MDELTAAVTDLRDAVEGFVGVVYGEPTEWEAEPGDNAAAIREVAELIRGLL